MIRYWLLTVFVCGALAISSSVCDAGPQPQPAADDISEIQIDGGYGYLRCLTLYQNGAAEWTGYEPPRQSYSQHKVRLTAEETKRIFTLAKAVNRNVQTNMVTGGNQGCKLVFVFGQTTREIRIKSDTKELRPPALKELMDALYKTRSAPGKQGATMPLTPKQEAMLKRVTELLKESGHWYPDYPLESVKFDKKRGQWMFLFSGSYVDAGVAGFITDENSDRIDILLFPPMWTKYERKQTKR